MEGSFDWIVLWKGESPSGERARCVRLAWRPPSGEGLLPFLYFLRWRAGLEIKRRRFFFFFCLGFFFIRKNWSFFSFFFPLSFVFVFFFHLNSPVSLAKQNKNRERQVIYGEILFCLLIELGFFFSSPILMFYLFFNLNSILYLSSFTRSGERTNQQKSITMNRVVELMATTKVIAGVDGES